MRVQYATSARGSVRHVRNTILPEEERGTNDSLCQGAQLVAEDADPALDVCLKCKQILNRMIANGLQLDGTCWMSGTTWQGKAAMRISVSNWSTTEEDVDRSVAAILALL